MNKISQEDMDEIKSSRIKSTILSLASEKALLEAQKAELERKNVILNVFVKYGLDLKDQILDDGSIQKLEEKEITTDE